MFIEIQNNSPFQALAYIDCHGKVAIKLVLLLLYVQVCFVYVQPRRVMLTRGSCSFQS